MSGVELDWTADDVVIQPQPAIAVYLNPAGAVVIRADGGCGDDPFITIRPEHAPALCEAISRGAAVSQTERLAPPPPAKARGTANSVVCGRRAEDERSQTP